MSEWKKVHLAELCDKITVGHVGSMASRYTADGIPFLRSQNVRPGRLDISEAKYIPVEFHQELRKSALQPGDIVIVRTGEPGAAAVIPDDAGEMNCADVVIARPARGVDSRFLCYSINATAGRYISTHLVGAVQQHFNVGSARKIEISLPSFAEQQSIADLLGAFDDKIAVNDRIARKADGLRSLHLSKFLQEQQANLTEVPLSSLADFVNGRAFTKNASGTGRMVIRIAELKSGPGGSTVYNDIEVPEKHTARPGDVLFAWSGSLCVARWFRDEAIVNQHIFKVIPKAGMPSWLLYELVQSKLAEFQRIAADKATTMGHIQRRHLDEPVNVPDEAHIPTLDGDLGPLWDRALLAERESLGLTNLRDTLLPKLMSGQVRIRDAEKVVEDAV